MKKKSKLITLILLIMTIFLMGAILYIGYILTANTNKALSVAPQTTKAQTGSYNKFIALDRTGGGANSTPVVSPTPTVMLTLTPTPTPTPTEIVLAYQNLTPTLFATTSGIVTPNVTLTITPTKVVTLPRTGFITNAIVLFGVSALVIFISFIF